MQKARSFLRWRGRAGFGLSSAVALAVSGTARAQAPGQAESNQTARQNEPPSAAPAEAPPGAATAAPPGAATAAPPAITATAALSTTTAEAPVAPGAADSAGISLGLRLGWGFPMGSLASGDKLGDNFNGMLPIWVDAGYRFSRAVYVGLFGQWAPAFVSARVCPPVLSCSATDVRVGVDGHLGLGGFLGLTSVVPVDPWVGLGAGYESTTTQVSALGTRSHTTDHGFEFGNVQFGADYTGMGPWRVGAFFTLTLAQYSRLTVAVPSGTSDVAMPDPALHLWFIAGLRGRYDL